MGKKAFGVRLEVMAERLGIPEVCLQVLAENHVVPYADVEGEMRFNGLSVGYALRALADRVAPTSQSANWGDGYLDLVGLTQFLCTSRRQVHRMLSAGRLPNADVNLSGTNSSKGRRWLRDSVMAYLKGRPYA